jgi:hypothetical protein
MTADQCRGCPFPDQTAALELVRLREGIGRFADLLDEMGRTRATRTWADVAVRLRALLDDNEGER